MRLPIGDVTKKEFIKWSPHKWTDDIRDVSCSARKDVAVGIRCIRLSHVTVHYSRVGPCCFANQQAGMWREQYSLVAQLPFKDNGVAFEKVFVLCQIFPEHARGDRTQKKSHARALGRRQASISDATAVGPVDLAIGQKLMSRGPGRYPRGM